MNANRLMIALAVLVAITAAVVTTSFAEPPMVASPVDDFALRHPAGFAAFGVDMAAFYSGSDYAQRHPELSASTNEIDNADYFLRHPELIAVENSDFSLRHPEWTILSPVVDTSDYAARHPELSVR